mgnify:CR=1 FL=1
MTAKTNKTTTETTLEITKEYYTKNGVVVGKRNGFKVGTAREYKADTLDELKAKLDKAFNSGSIDSDGELFTICSAGVQIVEKSTTEIDGKVFTNETITNYTMGDTDLFDELVEQGVIIDDLNESF